MLIFVSGVALLFPLMGVYFLVLRFYRKSDHLSLFLARLLLII